ncbi:MAG: hypothetical protein U9R19_12395, partial [Bacteroidota bacterium]|nr:hypothetical protein [Bacteroidota bacterium]
YEKRLSAIKIKIIISQEIIDNQNSQSIKTRLDIEVNGTISKTNSPFQNVFSMYISPYSSLD